MWQIANKMLAVLTAIFFLTPSILFADASDELMTALAQMQTMKASFHQKITGKNGEVIDNAIGTMALKRPGYFRWEINEPVNQIIVAKEGKLWIYDKDLEQVTIRSLEKNMGSSPALLLTGDSPSIMAMFHVENLTTNKIDNAGYILRPVDDNAAFSEVQLHFAQQKLVAMSLYDNLGQKTQLTFSQIKINEKLNQSFFEIKLPPGVDVIKDY